VSINVSCTEAGSRRRTRNSGELSEPALNKRHASEHPQPTLSHPGGRDIALPRPPGHSKGQNRMHQPPTQRYDSGFDVPLRSSGISGSGFASLSRERAGGGPELRASLEVKRVGRG